MGRSNRPKERTKHTTSGIQPTFIIVGAPGTRKSQIAEDLLSLFPEQLLFPTDPVTNSGTFALGSLADYRIELKLALGRILETPTSDLPTLRIHSLIDNLAYITFALSRYQMGTVSQKTAERAVLIFTVIGNLLVDSFEADHVFFLMGDFDPVDDYEQYELQSILQMILDEYSIPYSLIESNEDATEKIAVTIGAYLG